MKRTFACWIVALLSACGAPQEEIATGEAAILGSDACKNVDIRVTNFYRPSGVMRLIKVLSVDFYSASEGRWITEDLENHAVVFSTTREWTDEDLQYLENDLITRARVNFRVYEDDGDWSAPTSKLIDLPDSACLADADFSLRVE